MTRRRRINLALAATVVAATVAPAGATASAASLPRAVTVPVRLSGTLEVTFHGDPATGCAAEGVCNVSGAVSWTPAPSGEFVVIESRAHGRTRYSAVLEGQSPIGGGITSARVDGPSPGTTCADETASGSQFSLPVRSSGVGFDLASSDPSVLQTRCAGPLISDITATLPLATLPVTRALAGHVVIAPIPSGSFAAAGFAGQVTSTVSLALGTPRRQSVAVAVPGRLQSRYHQVVVDYAMQLHGTVQERFTADTDTAICGPLGACGLAGSASLQPDVAGTASLSATSVGGRRPQADYLTALGLAGSGNAHGISRYGTSSWSAGGSATFSEQQGSGHCSNTVPLGAGTLAIQPQRGRYVVLYLPAAYAGIVPGGSRIAALGR